MFERLKAEGQRLKWGTRTLCALLLFSIYPLAFSLAQEAPATTPKPGARLMFVPPPMEGTISMGIYDGSGKLVCALHREEEVQSDAFGKALNGLITSWDGKNDAGAMTPAGKYFARGYMVGDIATEGEAMHGNDFIVDDDSPRVQKVLDIKSDQEGGFGLIAQTSQNTFLFLLCDKFGAILRHDMRNQRDAIDALLFPSSMPISILNGKIDVDSKAYPNLHLPPLNHPIHACPARDGGVWVIDSNSDGVAEVKQFSTTGEFTRRLGFQPEEPAPIKIAASRTDDEIFLLEQNKTSQRVRALALVTGGTTSQPVIKTSTGTAAVSGTEQATSTWKVLFSKTITFSDSLDQARGLLKFPDGKPFEPQEKIRISLLPNPLVQDQPGSMEISAGIDAGGSFLKTTDGLLLKRISDTPNLKWAAIGRESGSKIIVLFQSDGAVVEEYRITRPANMMAFDCGDFDFDPGKMK